MAFKNLSNYYKSHSRNDYESIFLSLDTVKLTVMIGRKQLRNHPLEPLKSLWKEILKDLKLQITTT